MEDSETYDVPALGRRTMALGFAAIPALALPILAAPATAVARRRGPRPGRELFRLELASDKFDGPRLTSVKGKSGMFVASGLGTASGRWLSGKVTYDLYENRKQHGDPDKLAGVFGTDQFIGKIETSDGAIVRFETRGIWRMNSPKTFINVSSMRLRTDDARYAWLNYKTAFLEGTAFIRERPPRYVGVVTASSQFRRRNNK